MKVAKVRTVKRRAVKMKRATRKTANVETAKKEVVTTRTAKRTTVRTRAGRGETSKARKRKAVNAQTVKRGTPNRKARKRKAAKTRAVNRKARTTKTVSRIVVFACSWYPAIAADNAGVVGREYPADTRIVTLACAGRLTPSLLLDAFGAGADGVLAAACKPELCHHVNGSSTCEQVVAETRQLAELLGIGAERIHLETFDREEGELFAGCVEGFWKRVRKLGPIEVEE